MWKPLSTAAALLLCLSTGCVDSPREEAQARRDTDTMIAIRRPQEFEDLGLASRWGASHASDVWHTIDSVTLYDGDIYVVIGTMAEVVGTQSLDTIGPLAGPPHMVNDSVMILRVFSTESDPPVTELWLYNRLSKAEMKVSPPPDLSPRVPIYLAPSRPLIAYEVRTDNGGIQFVVRRWGNWQLLGRGREWRPCIDVPLNLEWSQDEQYIRWRPPDCVGNEPLVDSLRCHGEPSSLDETEAAESRTQSSIAGDSTCPQEAVAVVLKVVDAVLAGALGEASIGRSTRLDTLLATVPDFVGDTPRVVTDVVWRCLSNDSDTATIALRWTTTALIVLDGHRSENGEYLDSLSHEQRVWAFDVRVVRSKARWLVDEGTDELPGMISPTSALAFFSFTDDDRRFLSSLSLTVRSDSTVR